MAVALEFFFDCSSPWTYLAFVRVQKLANRTGANLVLKPFLVGGVFNKVNASVYESRKMPNPRKASYSAKDLQDWARYIGIDINWPSIFPVKSVTFMRACFYAEAHGKLADFAKAGFEAYWRDGLDISLDEEVANCGRKVGLDGLACLEYAKTNEAKAQLFANTEELIERGGFGSPTLFVDYHDMYFGNDRMELVEYAINRRAQNPGSS